MGSYLSDDFLQSSQEIVGKALDKLRQDYFIHAQMRGSDDASIGGVRVNKSGRQDNAALSREQEKRSNDDIILLALLDDIRDRLETLENNMLERYALLQEKYHGADVIDTMANIYLSDEELAGLTTDEDKLRALADKFLDENGEIKEQYKDLEEAKYVRDWNEAQKLQPIVAQYEGRNDLSQQEIAHIKEAVQNTSLADNQKIIALSDNQTFQNTVAQEVDQTAGQYAGTDTNTSYGFK